MSHESMSDYQARGESRALALGNRGPLRFDPQGDLAPEILASYRETGFYVFEGVLDDAELAELDADFAKLLQKTPATKGATVDRLGDPLEPGLPSLQWARALSDPWGGTSLLNGRHPVRMDEPSTTDESAEESTEESIFLLLGLFESMESALRLSAHPGMLRVAASLNGADFVPYNDSIFLKEPGVGAAVAWHQDGTTHWGSPDWHADVHGVNFMAQLCRTTAGNGLWVVPGSHRLGHIDIPERVAKNDGSTQLPDAVPMLCERGDVAVCNRQCLHGSFANASPDRRVTFVWGFFRRDSVLNVEVDVPATSPDQPPQRRRYSHDMIQERAALVQLAIDARAAHRPHEARFAYAPGESTAGTYPNAETRRAALRGYRNGTIFV